MEHVFSTALVERPNRSAGAVSMVNAFLAGFAGHRTDLFGSLLPEMSWRHGLRDVTAEQLLAIYSARRGHNKPIDIVILVHGLLIDEQNWTTGPDPLMHHTERIFGWTPLLVRYNTGLHISENGKQLADLIENLAEVWGPRLGRIQIMGHSMGGLVTRATLRQLEERNASVLNRIERAFLLATPNHGAALERVGHLLEYSLQVAHRLPASTFRLFKHRFARLRKVTPPVESEETSMSITELAAEMTGMPLRVIQSLLSSRSHGIQDVRFGYIVEAEWQMADHDKERFMLNHRRPVPPPDGVRVYCVAGSLWPDVGTRPSKVRNDGLVSVASAAGKGGEFDDLGVVEKGRFFEVPLLVHQLVPSSTRVLEHVRHWVEHDL